MATDLVLDPMPLELGAQFSTRAAGSLATAADHLAVEFVSVDLEECSEAFVPATPERTSIVAVASRLDEHAAEFWQAHGLGHAALEQIAPAPRTAHALPAEEQRADLFALGFLFGIDGAQQFLGEYRQGLRQRVIARVISVLAAALALLLAGDIFAAALFDHTGNGLPDFVDPSGYAAVIAPPPPAHTSIVLIA